MNLKASFDAAGDVHPASQEAWRVSAKSAKTPRRAQQRTPHAVPLKGPRNGQDLARFELFEGLTETELHRIWSMLRPRLTKPSEIISFTTDDEPTFALAWEGIHRATIMSPSGLHVTIRSIRKGEHFGEFAVFSNARQAHYHILVDEPGLLLLLSGAELKRLVAAIPRLRDNALARMALEGLMAADRIFEFVAINGKMRLQAELLRQSANGSERDGAIVIAPAPKHEALASLVGLTREQVTRYMAALAQQGLLRSRRGEIVILDIERLRALVEREAGRLVSHHQAIEF